MPLSVTAVVPLKAVHSAKTRMGPALSAADKALLLHRTFKRVIAAIMAAESIQRCVVVVGDDEGQRWAHALDVGVITESGDSTGLNAALAAADAELGDDPTLVLPADLPLVTGDDLDAVIAALPGQPGIVVAPTDDGGTGALLRAPGGIIRPCFGVDSAAAHLVEARRRGVASHEVWVPGLALDLDQPDDIAAAGGWAAVTRDVPCS